MASLKKKYFLTWCLGADIGYFPSVLTRKKVSTCLLKNHLYDVMSKKY